VTTLVGAAGRVATFLAGAFRVAGCFTAPFRADAGRDRGDVFFTAALATVRPGALRAASFFAGPRVVTFLVGAFFVPPRPAAWRVGAVFRVGRRVAFTGAFRAGAVRAGVFFAVAFRTDAFRADVRAGPVRAGAFRAGVFFAVAFRAVAVRADVRAGAFLAVAFRTDAFRADVRAGPFRAGVFFAVAFVVGGDFLAAVVFRVAFAGVFFAAAFGLDPLALEPPTNRRIRPPMPARPPGIELASSAGPTRDHGCREDKPSCVGQQRASPPRHFVGQFRHTRPGRIPPSRRADPALPAGRPGRPVRTRST
jgi:hypothetical protein